MGLRWHIRLNEVNIYRILHPKMPEYTFFSNAHREFSRKDHMLDNETNLDKSEKTDIIPNILSGKITNMWRLNSMPLNNYWVKEEIRDQKIHKDK